MEDNSNQKYENDSKLKTKCPYCNMDILGENKNFCPYCGKNLKMSIENKHNVETVIANTVDSVKNSEIITSVKSDINNSKTIGMIKDSAQKIIKNTKSKNIFKNKKIIIGVTIVVLLTLIIIISNIHTCDECDKVYFGKKNEISFFGQTEDVCKECYRDFYMF